MTGTAVGGSGAGPDDEVLRARVYLNAVAEPANVPVWGFVTAVGAVEAAARIRTREALPKAVASATLARCSAIEPDAVLAAAARSGMRLVVPEADDWPHFALACLEHAGRRRLQTYAADPNRYARQGEPVPPLALWASGPGHLTDLAVRSVGVVGSRASTSYGELIARRLGRGLAERDVVVVSGGAFGIDAAAHRGALEVDGDTVLVSAGGLDGCYPPAHDRLFRAVAERGLLVSEAPPGETPRRHRFLVRNRLIAALSTASVVVEAALRSGALNTLGHCERLGRPGMAVPGPIDSATSAGCHDALRSSSGTVALVTSVDEVLGVMGDLTVPVSVDGARTRPGPADRRGRVLDGLDDGCRAVFDALPAGRTVSVDELVHAAGLAVSEVLRSLPVLELAGLIDQPGGGVRIRG